MRAPVRRAVWFGGGGDVEGGGLIEHAVIKGLRAGANILRGIPMTVFFFFFGGGGGGGGGQGRIPSRQMRKGSKGGASEKEPKKNGLFRVPFK